MKLVEYFLVAILFYLVTLQFTLAIDFSTKRKMITDFVNSYKTPTSVLLHSCMEKRFELVLAKELIQKKTVQYLQDVTKIRRQDLLKNGKNLLFIVDLKCSGVKKILEQSSALNLFREPYRWLLLDSPDEHHNVSRVVADLYFPTDSEVALVRETARDHFKINFIYKISADDEWRIEPYGHWNLTHGLHKSAHFAQIKPTRRQNLHGHQLGVGWVIKDNSTLYKYLNKEDPRDPQVDGVTKSIMVTGGFLIDFLNASQKLMITNNWGSKKNNTWDGLSGLLERGDVDIGGTPMFIVPERFHFIEYIVCSTRGRSSFVFLQPPLSYTSNIFLLSFQKTLWYGLSILLCVLFFILGITTFWESKKTGANSCTSDTLRPNVLDVGMLIVGTTCQQGSTVGLKGSSGRIVLLFFFVAITFLYTSFCANIVVLLQSSSLQIKTLQDLLESKLKLGIEENVWIKRYLKMETEPVRKALYEKKIAPHGKIENLLGTEKGVKEIRKGQFAFHMHLEIGHTVTGKYLEEHEKCKLEEIPFLLVTDPYVTARKYSPFIEIYKIGYKRIQEHGLQFRENQLLYAQKPKCSGKHGTFVSVSLMDCGPAFLVLAYGTLIAVLVCVFENVHHRFKKQSSQDVAVVSEGLTPIHEYDFD